MAQESVGSGAAPARIARRKMHADVAGPDRPEHARRSAREARHRRPSGPRGSCSCGISTPHIMTWSPGAKGCTSKPCPTRISPCRRGEQPLGSGEILRCRDLQIVLAAFDDQRRHAGGLGDRGIVGQRPPGRGAMRGEDRVEMKALRRLRPPQSGTVDGLADHAVFGALDRVAEGRHGIAAAARSSPSIIRSISPASGNGRAPSWISTRSGR